MTVKQWADKLTGTGLNIRVVNTGSKDDMLLWYEAPEERIPQEFANAPVWGTQAGVNRITLYIAENLGDYRR